MKLKKLAILATAVAMLASCGSKGSDTPVVPPPGPGPQPQEPGWTADVKEFFEEHFYGYKLPYYNVDEFLGDISVDLDEINGAFYAYGGEVTADDLKVAAAFLAENGFKDRYAAMRGNPEYEQYQDFLNWYYPMELSLNVEGVGKRHLLIQLAGDDEPYTPENEPEDRLAHALNLDDEPADPTEEDPEPVGPETKYFFSSCWDPYYYSWEDAYASLVFALVLDPDQGEAFDYYEAEFAPFELEGAYEWPTDDLIEEMMEELKKSGYFRYFIQDVERDDMEALASSLEELYNWNVTDYDPEAPEEGYLAKEFTCINADETLKVDFYYSDAASEFMLLVKPITFNDYIPEVEKVAAHMEGVDKYDFEYYEDGKVFEFAEAYDNELDALEIVAPLVAALKLDEEFELIEEDETGASFKINDQQVDVFVYDYYGLGMYFFAVVQVFPYVEPTPAPEELKEVALIASAVIGSEENLFKYDEESNVCYYKMENFVPYMEEDMPEPEVALGAFCTALGLALGEDFEMGKVSEEYNAFYDLTYYTVEFVSTVVTVSVTLYNYYAWGPEYQYGYDLYIEISFTPVIDEELTDAALAASAALGAEEGENLFKWSEDYETYTYAAQDFVPAADEMPKPQDVINEVTSAIAAKFEEGTYEISDVKVKEGSVDYYECSIIVGNVTIHIEIQDWYKSYSSYGYGYDLYVDVYFTPAPDPECVQIAAEILSDCDDFDGFSYNEEGGYYNAYIEDVVPYSAEEMPEPQEALNTIVSMFTAAYEVEFEMSNVEIEPMDWSGTGDVTAYTVTLSSEGFDIVLQLQDYATNYGESKGYGYDLRVQIFVKASFEDIVAIASEATGLEIAYDDEYEVTYAYVEDYVEVSDDMPTPEDTVDAVMDLLLAGFEGFDVELGELKFVEGTVDKYYQDLYINDTFLVQVTVINYNKAYPNFGYDLQVLVDYKPAEAPAALDTLSELLEKYSSFEGFVYNKDEGFYSTYMEDFIAKPEEGALIGDALNALVAEVQAAYADVEFVISDVVTDSFEWSSKTINTYTVTLTCADFAIAVQLQDYTSALYGWDAYITFTALK